MEEYTVEEVRAVLLWLANEIKTEAYANQITGALFEDNEMRQLAVYQKEEALYLENMANNKIAELNCFE